VNNLKQMGLAARIYAVDHEDAFPPDLLSMREELGSPKVLVCPQDPAAAQVGSLSWESLRPEGISYEYFGAGKKDSDPDPRQVLFRCRFHGHVCRLDGSVQMAPSGTR
jgi:hypothetical protein